MAAVSRLKILIAHNEPLVRAGLESTLTEQDDFEVATETDPQAVATVDGFHSLADVVLADRDTGIELACCDGGNTRRIVIITQDDSEASIRRAMEAGVRGYLLLGATLQSVIQAVYCVVRGGTALDPIAATRMMDSLNGTRLTDRELEVLSLLMLGLSDKAVAHRLGISPGTAKSHVKRVLTKLGATCRTEAVVIAQRRGLLSPQSPRGRRVDEVKPPASSSRVDLQGLRNLLRRSALATEPAHP